MMFADFYPPIDQTTQDTLSDTSPDNTPRTITINRGGTETKEATTQTVQVGGNEPDNVITVMRGGKPVQKVAWNGEGFTDAAGMQTQYYQNQKLQNAQYVVHNTLAFQMEADQMTEALKKNNPTGVGYANQVNQYMSNRIDQIISGAPQDEQTRFQLDQKLNQMRSQMYGHAVNTEEKLTRTAVVNDYENSKSAIIQAAQNDDPKNMNQYLLEIADKLKTTGQMMQWNQDDITNKATKDLNAAKTAILTNAATNNPDQFLADLKGKQYNEIITNKERDALAQAAKNSIDLRNGIQELPPIKDIINKVWAPAHNGEDLNHMVETGQMSPIEAGIAHNLQQAEANREVHPQYKLAKDALTADAQFMPNINPSDEQFRLQRLQTIHDSGQYNQQTIPQINQETQQRLTNRIKGTIQDSQYFNTPIEKATDGDIISAKNRIAADIQSGAITHDQALEEFRHINQIRNHLNGN